MLANLFARMKLLCYIFATKSISWILLRDMERAQRSLTRTIRPYDGGRSARTRAVTCSGKVRKVSQKIPLIVAARRIEAVEYTRTCGNSESQFVQ